MNNPKVSLIVPIYNVENYLEKCLSSAISQTLQEIEIITINDGSTDKSREILQKFKDNDQRIIIIDQENLGLSGARNSGIKVAKGKYLTFLDSDDTIEKDMLKKMYQTAEENNAEIVQCRYRQVDGKGKEIHVSGSSKGFSRGEAFKRILAAKSSAMSCDKMFKKTLFIDNNILFPIGIYHEDVPTIYKLFYYAKSFIGIDDIFYNWLRREESISKSLTQKHIDDIFEILKLTKDFLLSENIYEKFESFYLRRCFHFTLGIIDRANNLKSHSLNEHDVIEHVIKKLQDKEIATKNNLEKLFDYDAALCRKYQRWEAFIEKDIKAYEDLLKCLAEKELILDQLNDIYTSRGYKILKKYYNFRDLVLPIGSKRREIIKRITNKKKEHLIDTSSASTTKKPMLNIHENITKDEQKNLSKLYNKFKGKRCFIIGNGPSLNKCDLALLKDEYTFAVNGIFYKTEEMGFKPTFYMVEDGHVIDDNLDKINAYDPEYKFFPSLYKKKIKKTDNTYFFSADLGFYRGDHPSFEKPRFSNDFSEVSYCGQSVTYLNMQLAYYLGFTEVYLIGMDFSYQIRETDEARGATLISNEDDVNHFHPEYFGKGKKWHDPKVHNVAKNYEFAKENFEKDGRNIYNATIGGKLEIFERIDYKALFYCGEK